MTPQYLYELPSVYFVGGGMPKYILEYDYLLIIIFIAQQLVPGLVSIVGLSKGISLKHHHYKVTCRIHVLFLYLKPKSLAG